MSTPLTSRFRFLILSALVATALGGCAAAEEETTDPEDQVDDAEQAASQAPSFISLSRESGYAIRGVKLGMPLKAVKALGFKFQEIDKGKRIYQIGATYVMFAVQKPGQAANDVTAINVFTIDPAVKTSSGVGHGTPRSRLGNTCVPSKDDCTTREADKNGFKIQFGLMDNRVWGVQLY